MVGYEMYVTFSFLFLHINHNMGRRRYWRFEFFGIMSGGVSVREPCASGTIVVVKYNVDTVSVCGGLRLPTIL